MEDDEEALLAQAIALSMQENMDTSDDTAATSSSSSSQSTTASSSTPATSSTAAKPADGGILSEDINVAMQDPDFINSLLASVPGANADELQIDVSIKLNTLAILRMFIMCIYL